MNTTMKPEIVKQGEGGAVSGATFVGNRPASCLDLRGGAGTGGRTLRQRFAIGDPRECPAGTAEEMKRRGYVGIYMKET